eukprot:12236809-Ditylum_brightwellii.AAC.1
MEGNDDDSALTAILELTMGEKSIASKRLAQDKTKKKGSNDKKQCSYNISKQCNPSDKELVECDGDGCTNLLHISCQTKMMIANNLEEGTTYWCLECLKIESKRQLDFAREPEKDPKLPYEQQKGENSNNQRKKDSKGPDFQEVRMK